VKHASYQKKLGLSLLLIPIVFLLFFGIGEMMEGTPGWIIHFIQLLPLLILLVIAVFFSEWAGYLLIVIGSLLGTLYLLTARFPLPTIVLVELMLFVMPVIAGILLLISIKKTNNSL